MAFLTELFVGTAGAALSTLPGWSIASNAGSANLLLDGVGGVYPSAQSGFLIYTNSTAPLSANYSVTAQINVGHTGVSTPSVGVRCSANNGYFAWFSAGEWVLYKVVAGTITQIGSNNASQIIAGVHSVTLNVNGNVLTVTVNGQQVIQVVDNDLAASGNIGLGAWYATAGTSIWLSNLSATDATEGQTINAPLIISAAQVFTPTIAAQQPNIIDAPLITSTAVVYAPMLAINQVFYINDLFSGVAGTLLQNHLNWVRNGGNSAANLLLNGNGGVYADINGSWVIYTNTLITPPTPDYWVTLDFNVVLTAHIYPGGGIRCSTGNGYFFNYGGGAWNLFRIVAGVLTQIGTSAVNTAVGAHTATIRANGTTITLTVDDIEVINVTDVNIVGAGHAGILTYYANAGSPTLAVGNFIATDTAPAQVIDAPLITSAAQLFAPTLSFGNYIDVPLITSTAQVFEPALAIQNTIDAPLITSVAVIFAPTISTVAAGFYVNPNVLNDTGDGSFVNPKKFIRSGIPLLQPGDTLWLMDGIYPDANDLIDNNILAAHPGVAQNYKTIRAVNDGGAVITAGLGVAYQATPSVYWQFEGMKFRSYTNKSITAHHCKFMRIAYQDGPLAGNDNIMSAGAFQLYEDCWIFGRGGRFNAAAFDLESTIFRRVLVRHDGGWGYVAGESANPEGGFTVYPAESVTNVNVALQNMLVLDCDTYVPPPMNDWIAFTMNTHFLNKTGVSADGCISMNNRGPGFGFEGTGQWVNIQLRNMISIGNEFAFNANMGSGLTAAFTQSLAADSVNGYGFADWSSIAGIVDFDQSIILNNPLGSIRDNNIGSRDYNNCFGNGANGNCGTNAITTNPELNGLLYPVRIEVGSPLLTAGPGGTRVGPEVLYKIGVSGTMYGEPGWDAVTNEPLWPWPYEDRIKADLASVQEVPGETLTGARGFAVGTSLDGSPQTLTKYVWEAFGNQIPADIYGTQNNQYITAQLITSMAQVFAPTLSIDLQINAPLITSTAVVFEPLIHDASNPTMVMPVINSQAAILSPQLSQVVIQTITPDIIVSLAQIHAPALQDAVTQSISLPCLVSGIELLSPVLRTLAASPCRYTSAVAMLNVFGKTDIALIAAPDQPEVTGQLLFDVLHSNDLSAYDIQHVLAADSAVERLYDAIVSAERLMDGYLAPRYRLPLEKTLIDQSSLADFCNDIARYKLMDDRTTEEVEKRYDEAIRWLRDVSHGKVSLGQQDTAVATPSGRMTIRAGRSKHDWGGY